MAKAATASKKTPKPVVNELYSSVKKNQHAYGYLILSNGTHFSLDGANIEDVVNAMGKNTVKSISPYGGRATDGENVLITIGKEKWNPTSAAAATKAILEAGKYYAKLQKAAKKAPAKKPAAKPVTAAKTGAKLAKLIAMEPAKKTPALSLRIESLIEQIREVATTDANVSVLEIVVGAALTIAANGKK